MEKGDYSLRDIIDGNHKEVEMSSIIRGFKNIINVLSFFQRLGIVHNNISL